MIVSSLLQLVFVSVGAVRKERHHDSGFIPSSSLPTPEWESTPMIILLQEQYFEQLFGFLEALDKFVTSRSNTANISIPDPSTTPEMSQGTVTAGKVSESAFHSTKVPLLPLMESRFEFLCGITWELLFLLPTNQSILNKLRYFDKGLTTDSKGVESESYSDQRTDERGQSKGSIWESLLDPNFPHKLLYSLQVIDLIHNSSKETQTQSSPTYSRLSSDSEISDNDEEKEVAAPQTAAPSWGSNFIELGGLEHLYRILMSGCLETKGSSCWTQWHQECLAHSLKLICEFGTMKLNKDDDDDVFASSESEIKKLQIQRKDGQFRVRYKSTDKEEVICIKCLSSNLMSILNVNSLLEKLLHISYQATLPIHGGQSRASGDGKCFWSCPVFLSRWVWTGPSGGGGVLSYKRLMGMCFWMGLRFPFSVELG